MEFIVAQDHFLTPTARYADIVLPATTFWERNDVHTPWAGAGHYAIFMKQAIEPMDECRNDIDIFADLAAPRRHRGLQRQDAKTDWLRELTARRGRRLRRLRRERRRPLRRRPRTRWPSRREIRDPERHKFTTPSGKIEIYSMALAANPDPYGLGAIPPIPTWVPPFRDGTRRYPLKLLHAEVAGADALDPRQPARARPRRPRRHLDAPGGRRARAASPTATACACSTIAAPIVLPARVTDRIAPGVVSIKEGAWFTPDGDGHRHAAAAPTC